MRKSNDFAEAFDFFGGDAAAEFCDAVIPPALVIEVRIGPFAALLNGALGEEFLDCTVERSCTRIEGGISALANFPKDGVAVTLAVSQGHENVQ